MKKFLFLLLLTLSCGRQSGIDLIPYPAKLTMGKGYCTIKNDGDIKLLSDAAIPPEGYRLKVDKDNAELFASDSAGFFYGLQTLSQLRKGDRVPVVEIEDAPKFAHRGVMVDVSRHFYSMEFLRRQVDLLSRYKINRFQIHLTDAAGWRMEIKHYPRLTQYAAFRSGASWKDWWDGARQYVEEGSEGAYGGYYTQAELRELVSYAAKRHVTIVPEIEMPGHSEEVLAAYPQLSCSHDGKGDFCVGTEETFEFLQTVLDEVMDVFPSEYIHIGGDEAGKASWRSCPKCQRRMQDEGLATVEDLQGYLIRRIGAYVKSKGRKIIGWDEIAESSVPDNADIMIWRGGEAMTAALKTGAKLILTPGKYYIDKYQDAPPTQKEAIGGYLPLKTVYELDPLEEVPQEYRANVKGLQVNLWTEYVATEEDAERMLYPRALALAQTAWGGENGRDYPEFRRRVLSELSAMVSEGYHPFDLAAEVGQRPEYEQKVEHLALGSPVTYATEYSPKYAAAGASSLTDGLQGSWTYDDGRWQGFLSPGMDVTIDLGKVQTISEIKAIFFQSIGAWIYRPSHIGIWVSEDGETFTSIADEDPEKHPEPSVDWFQHGWSGSASARYVRYQATCDITGGWVFTDEVVVK